MIAAFDRALAARAIGFALVAAFVAAVVVAATDELDTWAGRAVMIAALLPVAAAVGAAAATAVSDTRGELRALAALGVARARASAGAAIGAAAVALIAPVVVATHGAEISALAPRAPEVEAWVLTGDALASPTLGLYVTRDGARPIPKSTPRQDAPDGFAMAVTAALTLAAIAFPAAACSPRSRRRSALGVGIALVVALAAFHAVSARALAPAWLIVAPLLLLLDAASSLRGGETLSPARRRGPHAA